MKTALLGLGALFAGLVAIVVPSIVTDIVLHATGVLPAIGPMQTWQAAIAVGYRILYGVIGSYVTARLAPERPGLLVAVLASLGVAVGTAGAMATWNQPEYGPRWFGIAVALMPILCGWIAVKWAGRSR